MFTVFYSLFEPMLSHTNYKTVMLPLELVIRDLETFQIGSHNSDLLAHYVWSTTDCLSNCYWIYTILRNQNQVPGTGAKVLD